MDLNNLLAWAIGDRLIPCGSIGQPECNLCFFFVLINNILDVFTFYIATPAGLLVLGYAALIMIWKKGEPGSLAKAKGIVFRVFLGMIIIWSAWLIINYLVENLVNPEILSDEKWNQLQC